MLSLPVEYALLRSARASVLLTCLLSMANIGLLGASDIMTILMTSILHLIGLMKKRMSD